MAKTVTIQEIVENAIAGGKLSREETGALRAELSELRTADALFRKAAELVRGGNLFIPNGDPGRESALKWWAKAQEFMGWKSIQPEQGD